MTGFPNLPDRDPQTPSETQDSAEATPASMTLGSISGMADSDIGIEGFDTDETGPSDWSRITQHGAFAVVLVAVVGLGVILGMRLISGSIQPPSFDREAEALVITTIASIDSGQTLGGGIDLARPLVSSTEEIQQVPIEYVQKNPFLLDRPVTKTPDGKVVVDTSADDTRAKAALVKEVRAFEVNMVLEGKDGHSAVIDGNMYKAGDTLGSFTIHQINAQAVVFRSGQWAFKRSVGG